MASALPASAQKPAAGLAACPARARRTCGRAEAFARREKCPATGESDLREPRRIPSAGELTQGKCVRRAPRSLTLRFRHRHG
jgi:hypothetical protein